MSSDQSRRTVRIKWDHLYSILLAVGGLFSMIAYIQTSSTNALVAAFGLLILSLLYDIREERR